MLIWIDFILFSYCLSVILFKFLGFVAYLSYWIFFFLHIVFVDPKIPIMVLPRTIWSFQVLNRVLYLWQPEAPKKVLWGTFFLRVQLPYLSTISLVLYTVISDTPWCCMYTGNMDFPDMKDKKCQTGISLMMIMSSQCLQRLWQMCHCPVMGVWGRRLFMPYWASLVCNAP